MKILIAFLAFSSIAYADMVVIPIHLTAKEGTGKAIGTVTASDTRFGLLLTPDLDDLPPGIHGFHIHTDPSCANAGLAAGGHFDPLDTKKHLGPYDITGHIGDLPVLVVDSHGKATLPVLAPRLTVKRIEGHALMIHAHGDNYSDTPAKLGGGGPRLACGVIPTPKVDWAN